MGVVSVIINWWLNRLLVNFIEIDSNRLIVSVVLVMVLILLCLFVLKVCLISMVVLVLSFMMKVNRRILWGRILRLLLVC